MVDLLLNSIVLYVEVAGFDGTGFKPVYWSSRLLTLICCLQNIKKQNMKEIACATYCTPAKIADSVDSGDNGETTAQLGLTKTLLLWLYEHEKV